MNSTPQRQNIGLDRTGGPTLSPDMQRMRLRVLLSVAELPFADAIVEIRKRVQTEPSEMIRIALLAAQSWLVRERMLSITSGNDLGTVKSVLYPQDAPTPKTVSSTKKAVTINIGEAEEEEGEETEAQEDSNEDFISEIDDGWRRVYIVSDATVNGVRFFAGSVVEVGPIEAQKLVAAQKGELLMGGVGIRPDPEKSKSKTAPKGKSAAKPKAKDKPKASLSPVSKEDAEKIAQAEAELEEKLASLQSLDNGIDETQSASDTEPEEETNQGKAVVIARSEVTNFDDFEGLQDDNDDDKPS